MKGIVKIIHSYITEENVNSHFKNEFKPKKIEANLTNFIVYDLETHNTDRARTYKMIFYRLSKIAGRYERDPTQKELKNPITDILASVGDNCVGNVLDFLNKIQKRRTKSYKKTVENNFQLHAHNGSGFDTWITLNNHPCDKNIVDSFKLEKEKFL